MTSLEEEEDGVDNPYHDDPLLLLSSSPPIPPSVPEGGTNDKTTTTAAAASPWTIIKMILEGYPTWFVNQFRNYQNSKRSSSSSVSSSFRFGPYQDLLKFYIQFIASPSNQDKILKLLQYTFYIMSQALLVYSHHQKRTSSPLSLHTLHQQWLEKLYNEFTWTRYILRILQLPVAMDAAIHQSWTLTAQNVSVDSSSTRNDNSIVVSQRQKIYNLLGRLLTFSMVLYYPTELMAYLLWMKPKISSATTIAEVLKSLPSSTTTTTTATTTTTTLVCDHPHGYIVSSIYNFYTTLRDPTRHNNSYTFSTKSSSSSWLRKLLSSVITPSIRCPAPETWSYLSCRCWLIYVITELIQSYIQYQELLLVSSPSSNHSTTPCTTEYRHEQQQQIVLQTLRNLLFVIPCTTWSMPKWDTQPIVSLRTVNTLLWFESIVSIYQAIVVQRNKNRNKQEPLVTEPDITKDDNTTTETKMV